MKRLLISTIIVSMAFIGTVSAAEIRLVASGAMHDALRNVLSDFEKSSSHKVDVTWAGAAVYRPLLSSDKTFDAVIVASADADTFIRNGKLKAPETVLAKTGVGIGVRKGQPSQISVRLKALKRCCCRQNQLVIPWVPAEPM